MKNSVSNYQPYSTTGLNPNPPGSCGSATSHGAGTILDIPSLDTVTNPSYYHSPYGFEVWDAMEQLFGIDDVIAFCKLNAFKYRMRAGNKDSAEYDLAKEKVYLNKVIELKAKRDETLHNESREKKQNSPR